jgi:hypothetical protein
VRKPSLDVLAAQAVDAVSRLIIDGTLRVPVETLKLAQAADAHRQLKQRTNTGRLILARPRRTLAPAPRDATAATGSGDLARRFRPGRGTRGAPR